MSVDLMSHGGLNRKVQFSAPDSRYGAILGRDDRLVAKLADVVQKIDATFVAVMELRFQQLSQQTILRLNA